LIETDGVVDKIVHEDKGILRLLLGIIVRGKHAGVGVFDPLLDGRGKEPVLGRDAENRRDSA
jgi:hypothetical protein